MDKKKITSIIFAILAAVFYAINTPFSKQLLAEIDPSLSDKHTHQHKS